MVCVGHNYLHRSLVEDAGYMSRTSRILVIVATVLVLGGVSVWLLRVRHKHAPNANELQTPVPFQLAAPASSVSTSPSVESSVSPDSHAAETRPYPREDKTLPPLSLSPPVPPRDVTSSVSKEMLLAYHAESLGHLDEAMESYHAIAEEGRGSDQIGALNRYIFTMQRKHGRSNGLKAEVDRLKAKSHKTDFEWMFLSQFGSEVDPRTCYREVIANHSSPFAAYAKMKLVFHYDPRETTDVKLFARKAMADLQSFIEERPNDPLVDHAKLRIASCLKEIGEDKAAIDTYRRLLQTGDVFIRASCIHQLSKHQKMNDPAVVQNARLIAQFYGEWNDGYFMPDGFDPEHVAIDVHRMATTDE